MCFLVNQAIDQVVVGRDEAAEADVPRERRNALGARVLDVALARAGIAGWVGVEHQRRASLGHGHESLVHRAGITWLPTGPASLVTNIFFAM